MNGNERGQIRRSQVITTFGPGALIDLPRHSAIVGGLETWSEDLEEIAEPRLAAKLMQMTGVPHPRLYAPPPEPQSPLEKKRSIGGWRFPEWFVVQEGNWDGRNSRSRRLVHRKVLNPRGRFDPPEDNGRRKGNDVVATRFVRACARGHVDDIDWYAFVHGGNDPCRRQLWLDERGTSGDLAEQVVRCECGRQRRMYEAARPEDFALGVCSGARPWLGRHAYEACSEPSRLLIRTASNAWFPQVVSALSLPDRGSKVEQAVEALWDRLQIVDDAAILAVVKKYPEVANRLAPFPDQEVLDAIAARRAGGAAGSHPIKRAEMDVLLAAAEGYGDDEPFDPDFHARRLPERAWRRSGRIDDRDYDPCDRNELPDSAWRRSGRLDAVEAVIQVHRLREVLALAGFTRLEAVMPDVDGEYDAAVERADLAREPQWFPAVENRGEGIVVQLRAESVREWLERDAVKARLDVLMAGHDAWAAKQSGRRSTPPQFPGGPYVLLHTLAHLLIQSLALRCGYPAASIRERIFVDDAGARHALLLYTATPDAEGTLGGLVQQARDIEAHLRQSLETGALCSNDPVCAEHVPGDSMEERWLHGAACHGCALIAEPSCEMRNEYLDRALVVPTLQARDAAFFNMPV